MNPFERTELLLGDTALQKFSEARVAVVGLGGVGSYAAEALVRGGIGKILLVDFDKIEMSNINRQLAASQSTIGELKTEILKQRFEDINPDAELEIYTGFCDRDSFSTILKEIDFVVDAIDSISHKVGLIEYACHHRIPIVSVMGAGNRIDPQKITITDISKTYQCPLAKRVRKHLSKRGIKKGVPTVFSYEKVIKVMNAEIEPSDEQNIKKPVGTISYMPAMMGMWAASYVLRSLAGNVSNHR